jgi:hypothetical protein
MTKRRVPAVLLWPQGGRSRWIHAARSTRPDAKGRRTAVVLPIAEYEQLVEDLHDLAVVAERRDEEPIDEAELTRRLAGGRAV